jgi:hypothetical protein
VKVFLKPFILLIPLLAGLMMMDGCHKELFSTKGALSFSGDTLTFDTVFTTLGSVTQSFTIRNTQNKSLNISDIKLLQLAGTQYRISIPPFPAATAGIEYKNIDIPAHDSLYVFVEVTINPNTANNPFIVLDQIKFVTNGITQDVTLEAMGQNAHYYFSYQVLRGATFTFPTDKPNIIVNKNGGLPIFAVDTGATCIIPAGCKIFMAPNAVMTVDGTLNALATSWSDSTIFQYIRTDYGGLPGQWLGITYSRKATINMSHVIIDQSTFGISDEYVLDEIAQAQITTSNLTTNYINSPSQQPAITLNNVIIRNTTTTAMQAICTKLTATNCLFFSSEGVLIQIGMGGTYNITNCTFANNYGSPGNTQNPILNIIDEIPSYLSTGPPVGPYATTVNINNTIVAGNTGQNGDQLGFLLLQQASDHLSFNNCFLTAPFDSISAYATNTNNIDTAVDPQQSLSPMLFTSPQNNNYMPDSASIVIGRGNDSTHLDLYGYSRSPNPCIGAIQWHH